jgi:hypothetical protein
MKKILLDEWHIDFYQKGELSRKEIAMIRRIFKQNLRWLPTFLRLLFGPGLENKIDVEIQP